MTILWCGGEDIDYAYLSIGASYSTSVTGRRSSYARCSIELNGNETEYGYSPIFSPITSGYVMCVAAVTSASSGFYYRIVGFRNSSTGDYLGIGFDGYNRTALVKKESGGSRVVLASAAGTLDKDISHKFDFHLETYGVSGKAAVYEDGVKVVSFEGDNTVGSTTEFDQVAIYGTVGGSAYGTYISEVIVSDTPTMLMSLKTLAPNAAGDANEWDSGSYTSIDEMGASAADVIATEGVEDNFQCNLTGMPTGSFKVKAVKVVASAADEQEQMGLKIGVKTNGAVHLGSAHSLIGTWQSIEKLYQTNPETASAFTSGEIDSLQLALRTDSTTTTSTTV